MSTIQRLALVLTSSILATAAFPPVHIWWLVLVAWIPLFVAIRGLSARPAFYLGLLQGFLLYGITLSWMWNIFSSTAIVLWLIIALFVGLACSLTATIRSRFYLKSTLAAAVWVGAEFFRSEIYMLHFPWMTPGVGMQPSWLSPIIGVYGVSFLIIFCAVLIAENSALKHRSKLISFGILAMLLVSGLIRPSAAPGTIPIISIQHESGSHSVGLAHSREALKKSKDHNTQQGFILWPELSITERALDVNYVKKDLFAFSNSHNHIHVFGAYSDAGDGLNYNSAYTILNSKILGFHHKNRPVPLFNDGVQHNVAKSIKTPLGMIGTPICFDCDHEAIIRRMVADGAQVLIVPSLDAKHWSERQHLQHGELFRHRAAENNRWIAVAASSGLTQIIDPHGNRIQSIPLIEEGYLIGKVGLTNGRTFYNRYGWMIGYLCMFITAAFLFVRVASNIASRFKK